MATNPQEFEEVEVTAPDGSVVIVEAPAGASDEQIFEFVRQNLGTPSQPTPQPTTQTIPTIANENVGPGVVAPRAPSRAQNPGMDLLTANRPAQPQLTPAEQYMPEANVLPGRVTPWNERLAGTRPVTEQLSDAFTSGFGDTTVANANALSNAYSPLRDQLVERGHDLTEYAADSSPNISQNVNGEYDPLGAAQNRIFRDAAIEGLLPGVPSLEVARSGFEGFVTRYVQDGKTFDEMLADLPTQGPVGHSVYFGNFDTPDNRRAYEVQRARLRDNLPVQFRQVEDTPEYREAVGQQLQDQGYMDQFRSSVLRGYGSELDAAEERSRNDGIIPNILGNIAGSTPDPTNLIGAGSGIVRNVLLNAGVEAGLIPWTNEQREQRGQRELTTAEHLTNVATAGVIGGVLEVPGAIIRNSDRASVRERVATASPDAPISAPTVSTPTARRTPRGRSYAAQVTETVQQATDYVTHVTREWTNAPDIEVRRNFNDLEGVSNEAIGVFNAETGRISINMEAAIDEARKRNLSVEDTLGAVTFHEGLGHNGLTQLFSDQLDDTLWSFYDRGTQSFRRRVDEWSINNPEAYANDPNRTARVVEEVLAEWSEQGPLPRTLFNRLADLVKGFGRSAGVDLKFSEREVRSILSMAHSAVVNGHGRDVTGNGFRYARTYHGSPHDFDEFDHSRMGTGEGAQAFGWGTYLTDTEAVARSYRDNITRRVTPDESAQTNVTEYFNQSQERNPRPTPEEAFTRDEVSGWVSELSILRSFGELKKDAHSTVEALYNDPINVDPADAVEILAKINWRDVQEAWDFVRSQPENPRPRGKVYEVDTPDDAAWLEWDRPLAQQDPRVQEAARQLGVSETDLSGSEKYPTTGADLYQRLERQLGSSRSVSEKLDSLGVAGNKYLDRNSRGRGEGSYNYVVFNDKTPKITNKYMKPRQRDELLKEDRRSRQRTAADNIRNEIEAAKRAGINPADIGLPDRYMRPSKDRADMSSSDIFEAENADAILDDLMEGYEPTVRTQDEAMALARARGFTAKDVKGLNTEELDVRLYQLDQLAVRMKERVTTVFTRMAENGYGGRNKADYLVVMARYKELVERLLGHSSEVGRAMAMHRNLLHTRKNLENMNELLSQVQGNNVSGFSDEATFMKFAQQVQALLETGNTPGATAMIRKVTKPYWWQYVLTFRHAAMLSGLGTHAKNMTDSAIMVSRIVEEKALAAVGEYAIRRPLRALGRDVEKGVTVSELLSHGYGLTKALLDNETWKNTWEAFKGGHGNRQYSSRIEMQDARFPGLAGEAINKVNDALYAMDTFFRAFHTNAHLYALGVREAHKQGFHGSEAFQEGTNIAANADAAMVREADRLTDEILLVDSPSFLSGWAERIKTIRPGMNAGEQLVAFVSNMAFPFLRVTDRLLWQALRRSPFAVFDKNSIEDFKAGGARRDIAVSRALMGTALAYYYWQQAEGADEQREGSIQGAGPQDYRKQQALEGGGFRENATIEGDRYVDATALNLSWVPWGLDNNVAASVATLRQRYEAGVAEEGEVAAGLLATARAFTNLLGEQTYAENLAGYTELFTEGRSAEEDTNQYADFAGTTISQFIPAAVRQYTQQVADPLKRVTTGDGSPIDRVAGRVASAIPGLSEDLPARQSVYGETMPQGRSLSGMSNFTPISDDPVISELAAVERSTPETISDSVPSTFQYQNEDIRLNAEQRQEWQRFRGLRLREWMEPEITNPEWRTYPDDYKIELVQWAQRKANQDARRDMIDYLGLTENEGN